jgi:hypothetical protein
MYVGAEREEVETGVVIRFLQALKYAQCRISSAPERRRVGRVHRSRSNSGGVCAAGRGRPRNTTDGWSAVEVHVDVEQ